ncbi:MAG: PH domain-containing protein [Actinomycetia bacterium]|nr:PH domain-containing protein [Actinomycetes bacterium]
MRPQPSRKLDKRITRVWRLSAFINIAIWAIILFVLIGVMAAILAMPDTGLKMAEVSQITLTVAAFSVAVVALLLLVFVVIVPKIRWIQWSFDIYEEEIDIHKGIFWRKRIIIPLIRVQNVDTRQGPLLRMCGLASFTVATAAGEHEIPGLETSEADALRDRVAILARIAQEDI